MDKIVCELLSELHPEFDYAESADFFEDGYLDSFDMMTLLTEVEKRFDIFIEGEDVSTENFNSIKAICNLVRKYTDRENS